MWDILGLTPEQIAKNEDWDPKKGRRERDFGDRVGDAAMSLLTGTDYSQRVADATRTQYTDDLQEQFGDRITRTRGVPGYDELGDLSRMSRTALDQELTRRKETKDARSKGAALTGKDRGEFTSMTDPGEILAHASKLVKDEKDTKERTERTRLETIRLDDNRRSDERFAANQALNIAQMEMSNKRLDNQMELAQMNQRMKMRQQDRADARAAKKDRQLMIMQLIKGMSQMGASIAI